MEKINSKGTVLSNGEIERLLRKSPLNETGYHVPIKGVFDIDTVPDGLRDNELYVTRGSISEYGYLFNRKGVEKIKKELIETGSEWRIPTDTEWGEMLNSLEEEEDRNHDSAEYGIELGCIAGLKLKDKNGSWKFDEDTEKNLNSSILINEFDLNILPSGYAEKEKFGKETAFWTDDMNTVRKFKEDYNGVSREVPEDGAYYSIRFIRDYVKFYKDVVCIINDLYHVVEVTHIDADGKEKKMLWALENVSHSSSLPDDDMMSVTSDRCYSKLYLSYKIGNDVYRKELKNNETIVYTDEPKTEYIVFEDKLIDKSTIIAEKIYDEQIVPINKELERLKDVSSEDVRLIKDRIEKLKLRIEEVSNNNDKRNETIDGILSQLIYFGDIDYTISTDIDEGGLDVMTHSGEYHKIRFDGNFGELKL